MVQLNNNVIYATMETAIAVVMLIILTTIVAKAQISPTEICTKILAKPKPEIKTYEFRDCIMVHFGSYLILNQTEYLELKGGVVNETSSRCYNGTAGLEPKLVINLDCGTLMLTVDFDSSDDNRSSEDAKYILLNGEFYLEDFKGLPPMRTKVSKLASNESESCLYYDSRFNQTVSSSWPNEIVFENLKYEIHRYDDNYRSPTIFNECRPKDFNRMANLSLFLCILISIIFACLIGCILTIGLRWFLN